LLKAEGWRINHKRVESGEKRGLESLKNRKNVEDYTSMMVRVLGSDLCTETMFGVMTLCRIGLRMVRKSEY
jgi:hypothetical protein